MPLEHSAALLSSYPPPKLPFVDSTLDQSTLDSSLEVNMGHTGFGDSASPLMPATLVTPTIRSFNGYRSTKKSSNLLRATSFSPKHQNPAQCSSFSRVYSATLSKFASTSSKVNEKYAITLSKALGSRNLKLRKRPGLPSFEPPHCERKVFRDGLVVQMIGSAIPPRLTPATRPEDDQLGLDSFLLLGRQMPHLGVKFHLDSPPFGLETSSAKARHIQVRSPPLEKKDPSFAAAVYGSPQTIYHSIEDLTLLGDRPSVLARPSTSVSPEPTTQVDLLRATSPILSASLMSELSPIILSELSSLGETAFDPSMQPAPLMPQTRSSSPVVTLPGENSSYILRLRVLDESNKYGHNDGLTVLNPSPGEVPADAILASESDLYGKDHRWGSLNPNSESVSEVRLNGAADQSSFVSSSSLLGPLTEADFEAKYREVFCTGFIARRTA